MEDDDDFGDLYTDVIQSFHSSSAPPPPLPVDLNLQSEPDILPSLRPQSNPDSQTLAAPNSDSFGAGRVSHVKLETKDPDSNEKEVNFDIEEEADDVIPGMGLIPGLSSEAVKMEGRTNDSGDDWDSDDSEYDLQIVLNDDHHPMDRGNRDVDDDDGLIIMADSELNHEEPEWGKEGQQEDGRREEGDWRGRKRRRRRSDDAAKDWV